MNEILSHMPETVTPLEAYGITGTVTGTHLQLPRGETVEVRHRPDMSWCNCDGDCEDSSHVSVREALDALGMPSTLDNALYRLQRQYGDLLGRAATGKGFGFSDDYEDEVGGQYVKLELVVGDRSTYSLRATWIDTDGFGSCSSLAIPFCPESFEVDGQQVNDWAELEERLKVRLEQGVHTITVDGLTLWRSHIEYAALDLAPGWEEQA